MSQGETPNSISSAPLKLLKVDVSTDENGTGVTMEFIDDNGTRFKTPSIPYPENFDPMKIEHAERRGDEIRIKNENGDLLISIHADNIEYNNPIGTSTNTNGQMFIDPELGEEDLPIRRFSLDEAHPSGIGFTRAFEQANQAQQRVDEAIQETLNARYDGQEELPKIKFDYEMKCTCCEGKIHYPDKIVKLLGEEGTIKYFEFCKKNGSEPQMFCCSCYALMQNNGNIISAVNKMNQKIKDMMDLTEREDAVTKREKELDEQIKAIKK